jgi:uncharacterized membrane protein (UPF0127 family)
MPRAHFLENLVAGHGRECCLRNDSDGAVIVDRLESACDSKSRRSGLLGRDRLDPGTALVIAPCNAVHTFGMRFPIDVLFVSKSGDVLKRVTSLRRGRVAGSLGAFAAIEFCANHPGLARTRPGDRLRVDPVE